MARKPIKMSITDQAARILYQGRREEIRAEKKDIAATLSEEESAEILKLTEDDAAAIRMLTRSIATQKEVRNSATYLQLLRTKLEWTRKKPAAAVEVEGGLEVLVRTISEVYRPKEEGTTVMGPGGAGNEGPAK